MMTKTTKMEYEVGRTHPKSRFSNLTFRPYGKKQKYLSLWDTVKGSPPDLKGKHPYTPSSGFTPGAPVFTHYTPARQWYYPPSERCQTNPGYAIERVTEMDIKKL